MGVSLTVLGTEESSSASSLSQNRRGERCTLAPSSSAGHGRYLSSHGVGATRSSVTVGRVGVGWP